jgi:hypothetical protein
MDDSPGPKISRKRRSLSWALPVALLITLLISWFAVKMEHAWTQKLLVEEIENMGGLVWYDYQFEADGSPSTKENEPPGPIWLRRLLGDDFFVNVTKLDLTQTDIPDDGLKHLDRLSDLQSLSLGDRITDAGLSNLQSLSQLHTLNLRTTRVTEAAIRDLHKALPHCTITTINCKPES